MFFLTNYFRGALTSKPYAFLARPWEFKSVDSIDFFDPLGSNIRIDLRGDKILRILPRSNDSINEDWISDKIRFICDAARLQRLDLPVLRFKKDFFTISWTQVFDFLMYLHSYNFLKNKSFDFLNLKKLNYSVFLSGLFVDLESASILSRFYLNFFYKNLNSDLLIQKCSIGLDREFLFFNKKLEELVSFQNLILIDLNIKTLAPVLAIRLRALAKAGIKIYNFGRNSFQSLFFDVGSLVELNKVISGRHWLNSKLLKEKTFFLIGDSFKFDNSLFYKFLNKFNFSFGVLASHTSTLNLKEYSAFNGLADISIRNSTLEFFNFFQTNCSTSFLSTLNIFDKTSFSKTLKVSLVSHGGELAELSDFVVPISSPFEQSKHYLNILAIKQKTRLCFSAPNNVLDHSDFLAFFYSAFLKNYLSKFEKPYLNFNLLVYCVFFSNFYLVSAEGKVWNLINYYFDSIENNSWVLSQFILFVFSDASFLLNELSHDNKFSSNLKKSLNTFFIMPIKLKNFGLLNNRLLADDNFYQNDEISLVSSTLSSASSRLISKSSFVC